MDQGEKTRRQDESLSASKMAKTANIAIPGKHIELEDEDTDDANYSSLPEMSDESPRDKRPPTFPVKNERDVLLRKVRSVLNKISSLNYHRLRKRWLNLIPNDGGHITEILGLVVAKAMEDTIYMHIYARLMGYIVSRKPPETAALIRLHLNTHLHHELQKLATDKEIALFSNLTECAEVARRKKVSLHRFIAELYCENKACTSKFLVERVTDLLIMQSPREADENLECLCVLLTFAGACLEEAKPDWLSDVFLKINMREMQNSAVISKRIKFMLLDLKELRSKYWNPHNKWWSPTVKVANASEAAEMEQNKQLMTTSNDVLDDEPPVKVSKGFIPRRPTKKHLEVRDKDKIRTIDHDLRSLLNKVAPGNVERMGNVFCLALPFDEGELDRAITLWIHKAMDDSIFVRIHAHLMAIVADKFRRIPLGQRIVNKVIAMISNPVESVTALRLLAELFMVDLVDVHQIKSAFEQSLISPAATLQVCDAMTVVGKKLDLEENQTWMNDFLSALSAKASFNVRLWCSLEDLKDLRNNDWIPPRPHADHCEEKPPVAEVAQVLDLEGLLCCSATNPQEFIKIFKTQLILQNIEVDKFVTDAIEWAVDTNDVEYQQMAGSCLRLLTKERIIREKDSRFRQLIGLSVQKVALMGKTDPEAWTAFGRIMDELYV